MIFPVGSQFQLNCSVAVGHRVYWAISVPWFNTELTSDRFVHEERLHEHGITVRTLDRSSQLVVNVTEVQLVDYIECVAEDINGTVTRGQQVDVTIYGKCILFIDLVDY